MNKRENELNKALEAMYFGFKAMTQNPDKQLAEFGFSRIHHRILYFIGRNQGCSVNQLLSILSVTKQYLNAPLRKLISTGFIDQTVDDHDRRVKRLQLSDKGASLERRLTGQQRKQFEYIFDEVGLEVEEHWYKVMKLLVNVKAL